MPAPSKKQYACKADDVDDIVCEYKGLRPTVLHNLHASGFDTTRYSDASEAYRQTAFDRKASATTRQKSKQVYIAEKRKVLRALASSKARNDTANLQKLRHGRMCASELSSGSKQPCRPDKNKHTEQVPGVNLGGAGDDEQREAEQTFACVSIVNDEEAARAKRIELVVTAAQPPDTACSGTLQNVKVQCADHDTPVIEKAEGASVDFEDDLLAEVRVWPTVANNQRTDNVVGEECVGATTHLSAIGLQSAALNEEVERFVNGQVVVEEFGLTLAKFKDTISLPGKSASAMLPALLSVKRKPAGFAERSSVRRRLREKTKPVMFVPTSSAGDELGAGVRKRLRTGVSSEISASGCAIALSGCDCMAPESMESHLNTFSFSVAQVSEIRLRMDAAMKLRRVHKVKGLKERLGGCGRESMKDAADKGGLPVATHIHVSEIF